MPDLVVLIQTSAMVVTALAAVGLFGIAIRLYRTLMEHDRVLFGEDAVEGWNGIVSMVRTHRREIEDLKEEVENSP